jgi:hypothetical protein
MFLPNVSRQQCAKRIGWTALLGFCLFNFTSNQIQASPNHIFVRGGIPSHCLEELEFKSLKGMAFSKINAPVFLPCLAKSMSLRLVDQWKSLKHGFPNAAQCITVRCSGVPAKRDLVFNKEDSGLKPIYCFFSFSDFCCAKSQNSSEDPPQERKDKCHGYTLVHLLFLPPLMFIGGLIGLTIADRYYSWRNRMPSFLPNVLHDQRA